MDIPATPTPPAEPPAPTTHSPAPWRVTSEEGDYGDQIIRDAREYEATHNTKGAPDKAARNQVIAAECDKAIAIAEDTP